MRPTLTIAPELLGKYLIRRIASRKLVGKIVEVEAYLGAHDPASHAYRGKTVRNEVMFRKGGHLYVYFTYGMHYCANVVTEEEHTGHAVLLRALEPLEGIASMKKRRALSSSDSPTRIASGPARLCQALGMTKVHNGVDLCGEDIYLTKGERISRHSIAASSRIGIRNGTEHLWRFYIVGNPHVSRPQRRS